ncbi:GNAT family N-acetyltransferase [Metabacillus litoralis]|uniref:GNAT family N-acetyltransferase n=1 Tax=Metabacillus litoralis TaxID=152268 RepID=A0A5C6W6E5_9BACI|nr:GNAT family N-acetyltransferase [Metabacillus litoralis]TXC92903.1 GNAT family N-acetyltransferase [Metabacillus litoralis]
MKNVTKAQIDDLEKLVNIDRAVIGDDRRRDYIKDAIEAETCIVVKEEEQIVGFLLYDTSFFGCSFISLIIVLPNKRLKGYASSMIEYMVSHSPTKKVFSSTNQSNVKMQKVFIKNGFIQSGKIENLDEGDPEIIYYKISL